MTYLIIGVALFCGIHLLPAATGLRRSLIAGIGENPYKGLFSVIALAGIVLMVVGYSRAELAQAFNPPIWGRTATAVFMLVSLILFAAANMPGNIKRITRHPMLWGLVLWAIGHVLSNGDRASLILFAGLGVFGLLAMLSANLRGAIRQTNKVSYVKDIMIIVAGTIAYVALVFAHPYFAGVAVR